MISVNKEHIEISGDSFDVLAEFGVLVNCLNQKFEVKKELLIKILEFNCLSDEEQVEDIKNTMANDFIDGYLKAREEGTNE